MGTHTRPGARLRYIAAVALAGATLVVTPPARAQQQGGVADTSAVARLEQTAAHLEQMLRTLRQNPALEEQWTDESVLTDAVSAARRGTRAAAGLARLNATLDSLRQDAETEGSGELVDQLGRISNETDRVRSALRGVAAEMAALRSVVHGEGAGAHPHPGSDTVAHGHGGGIGHTHDGLHFSHPMMAESVSPDTKLRFNFNNRQLNDEEEENTLGLAAEYAFDRSISIEASGPYSLTDEAFGFTHVSLKFANYAFEEAGVSLGYGLGAELPTSGDGPAEAHHGEEGEEHGHGSRVAASLQGSPPAPRYNGGGGVHGTLGEDFVTFEPFFNVGWKTGPLELVSFATFGIPSGTETAEAETELGWNVSALYQVDPRVQTLLEFDGTSGLSGTAVGRDVVNVSPGVKLRPSGDSPLFLGVSGSLPLTGDEDFDNRIFVSLFYHFH